MSRVRMPIGRATEETCVLYVLQSLVPDCCTRLSSVPRTPYSRYVDTSAQVVDSS